MAFAQRGAHVVIASRKLDNCEAVAEAARQHGVRALPYACHVGHWDDLAGLADAAYAEFGRVDVLVNNAGMSPLYPKLSAVTEELFDKVIGVNLKGPYRLSALIGERMAAGDGGSIVNVSSTAAVQPTPESEPYGAAKAGVNSLTLSLARAYAPKVRVNCIQAGAVPHRHLQGLGHGSLRTQRQDPRCPAARGEAEEVVGTALYLASAASSFTTGAIIRVDGGFVVGAERGATLGAPPCGGLN